MRTLELNHFHTHSLETTKGTHNHIAHNTLMGWSVRLIQLMNYMAVMQRRPDCQFYAFVSNRYYVNILSYSRQHFREAFITQPLFRMSALGHSNQTAIELKAYCVMQFNQHLTDPVTYTHFAHHLCGSFSSKQFKTQLRALSIYASSFLLSFLFQQPKASQ